MNYILEYPKSALLYLIVVTLNIIFSKCAEKNQKKNLSTILIVLVIILFSMVSGFRAYNIGTDTPNYVTHIMNYQMNSNYVRYATEPGLRILSILSGYLYKGPTFVLVTVSFLINTLIVIRLWSFKSKLSFSYAIFIYSLLYYFLTYSGIRQMLAVSIVFWASKYMIEKRYVKYVLYVVVASLFHNSAVIALGIPLLDAILSKKTYRKDKLLIFVILIPLMIIFSLVFIESQFGLFSRYIGYTTNLQFQSGTGITLWIRLLIGLGIFVMVKQGSFKNMDEYEFFQRNYRIYFVGLILIIPGYYIANINRIAFYFSIYEVIVFSILTANNRKAAVKILLFVITMFSLLMFIIELMYSGLGHMPYIPFWESNFMF